MKLSGPSNLGRIRVGYYRVVYEIEDDRLIVLVIHIAHRREVYRGLQADVKLGRVDLVNGTGWMLLEQSNNQTWLAGRTKSVTIQSALTGGRLASIDNPVEYGGESLSLVSDSDRQQKTPSGRDGENVRHVGLEPTTR